MRIRKFNESDETTMDFEYIKECFIELLDDVDFNSEIVDSVSPDGRKYTYISLGFDIPLVRMGDYFKEEELANIGGKLNSLFSGLSSSIEKVKLQYPNIFIEILHDNYGHDNHREDLRGKQYVVVNISTYEDF